MSGHLSLTLLGLEAFFPWPQISQGKEHTSYKDKDKDKGGVCAGSFPLPIVAQGPGTAWVRHLAAMPKLILLWELDEPQQGDTNM